MGQTYAFPRRRPATRHQRPRSAHPAPPTNIIARFTSDVLSHVCACCVCTPKLSCAPAHRLQLHGAFVCGVWLWRVACGVWLWRVACGVWRGWCRLHAEVFRHPVLQLTDSWHREQPRGRVPYFSLFLRRSPRPSRVQFLRANVRATKRSCFRRGLCQQTNNNNINCAVYARVRIATHGAPYSMFSTCQCKEGHAHTTPILCVAFVFTLTKFLLDYT